MNSHRKPGRQLVSITMQADGSILACFSDDSNAIKWESIHDFFELNTAGVIAAQFDSYEVELHQSVKIARARKRSGFKVIPGGKT